MSKFSHTLILLKPLVHLDLAWKNLPAGDFYKIDFGSYNEFMLLNFQMGHT